MKGLSVVAGLVIGNFLYAYLTKADFSAAAERSFFQAAAIAFYALTAQ